MNPEQFVEALSKLKVDYSSDIEDRNMRFNLSGIGIFAGTFRL